jgi:dipeptidyl aminopeptidase/acylaminoacyl peptidase
VLAVDLEQLLRIPFVYRYGGYSLSPCGSRVAYPWNETGVWEIWVADLGRAHQPRRVTSGPGAKLVPRWSPDGGRIAYLVDLDGSEAYDVHLLDLATGQSVNLTPETPYSIHSDLDWSPDGSRLALAADRDGRFDTYILSIADRSLRKALDQDCPDCGVRWSPDGRWIAVMTEGHGDDYWVYVVPAAGGTAVSVSLGQEPISAKDPAWSPDSRQLAFSSELSGWYNIGLFDVLGQKIDWLTEGEDEKSMPDWSPDGRSLAYIQNQGLHTALVVREPAGTSRCFRAAQEVQHRASFTPDGERLLFSAESHRQPPGLWLLSLEDGNSARVTPEPPEDVLVDDGLVAPERVDYETWDGRQVPTALYRPEAAGAEAPGLICAHGGYGVSRNTWEPLVQALAARGWVVLDPNYRGSSGWGGEWQKLNRFDLGSGDARDLACGARFLAGQRLADPARILVTGRSYGGYLTMVCLTQEPDLWAGGSAVVPFVNWLAAQDESREDLQHWAIEYLGDPVENRELWRERSPYYSLDRVEAPVQLICAANDVRCPVGESFAARDALVDLGKRVELLHYPDEGHDFLKLANIVDVEQRRLAFFERAVE